MFSYIVFVNVFVVFLLIYMKVIPKKKRFVFASWQFFLTYLAGDGEGGGGPVWDYLGTILGTFWDHVI